MATGKPSPDANDITIESLPSILENDNSVKLAGVDVDGVLRGKLVSKNKFLSIAKTGFGFCSVIFGWDMHDQTYFKELKISNKENGYRDVIAIPDLSSFRRIPWENNVPFFLVSFHDPDTEEPLSACPRSLLKKQVDKLAEKGWGAMAGGKQSCGGYTVPDRPLITDSTPSPQPNMSSTNSRRRTTANRLQPTSERTRHISSLP
jgi:glutamine synthetase